MNIIELVIDEDNYNVGVEAISVVHDPAIEIDFVALNSQQVKLTIENEEKRILLGPALIPNKQIYRADENIGEYYIWFSADTVRKASQLFLKGGNQHNSSFEHEYKLNDMTVVESWIIEDSKNDKANHHGYDLPKGTWMVSMKVDSDEVWDAVKNNEIKGFSIEGHFADKLEMSKVNDNKKDWLLINKVKGIIEQYERENSK